MVPACDHLRHLSHLRLRHGQGSSQGGQSGRAAAQGSGSGAGAGRTAALPFLLATGPIDRGLLRMQQFVAVHVVERVGEGVPAAAAEPVPHRRSSGRVMVTIGRARW
ncbi:hypothetical protein GCM10018790_49960 [Kitasatospora xanthocidica]|nr:hypothetical protein GCM10018790_49960 [Kitasatospora xanthocidica]